MPATVIEVHVPDTGDTAECSTPEEAVTACRTLGREAWDQRPNQGYDPTIQVFVNDKLCRVTTLRALGRL